MEDQVFVHAEQGPAVPIGYKVADLVEKGLQPSREEYPQCGFTLFLPFLAFRFARGGIHPQRVTRLFVDGEVRELRGSRKVSLVAYVGGSA